jgi:hypothetical protein
LATAVLALAAAACARRARPQGADDRTGDAGPATVPAAVARGAEGHEASFVEAVEEPAPDCLDRVDVRPFNGCVHDPANRDCGVRLAFSRSCEAQGALFWGELDDATRACLAAKAPKRQRDGVKKPVWFVDFPLCAPAFVAPADGIGEIAWLRRGLPKPVEAMRGVPRVALGPRTLVGAGVFIAAFGGSNIRLRMVGGPESEPFIPGFIALESGARTQILLTAVEAFRVRWAGDVDGDGRLDLLIQWTDTAFGRNFDLFVSGGAEGRLVRRAATYGEPGD